MDSSVEASRDAFLAQLSAALPTGWSAKSVRWDQTLHTLYIHVRVENCYTNSYMDCVEEFRNDINGMSPASLSSWLTHKIVSELVIPLDENPFVSSGDDQHGSWPLGLIWCPPPPKVSQAELDETLSCWAMLAPPRTAPAPDLGAIPPAPPANLVGALVPPQYYTTGTSVAYAGTSASVYVDRPRSRLGIGIGMGTSLNIPSLDWHDVPIFRALPDFPTIPTIPDFPIIPDIPSVPNLPSIAEIPDYLFISNQRRPR